jgi:hypothetical protein
MRAKFQEEKKKMYTHACTQTNNNNKNAQTHILNNGNSATPRHTGVPCTMLHHRNNGHKEWKCWRARGWGMMRCTGTNHEIQLCQSRLGENEYVRKASTAFGADVAVGQG